MGISGQYLFWISSYIGAVARKDPGATMHAYGLQSANHTTIFTYRDFHVHTSAQEPSMTQTPSKFSTQPPHTTPLENPKPKPIERAIW